LRFDGLISPAWAFTHPLRYQNGAGLTNFIGQAVMPRSGTPNTGSFTGFLIPLNFERTAILTRFAIAHPGWSEIAAPMARYPLPDRSSERIGGKRRAGFAGQFAKRRGSKSIAGLETPKNLRRGTAGGFGD